MGILHGSLAIDPFLNLWIDVSMFSVMKLAIDRTFSKDRKMLKKLSSVMPASSDS